MKLRGSHLVSLAILAGIGGWMFTGKVILGGQADPNAVSIADREANATSQAFRVRVTELQPSERLSSLSIRGRTKASATVSVRAETGGTVRERPVSKGQVVKAGDLLCTIDQGIRATNLTQAKAQLAQAQEDYDATEKLLRRGFATKTKLRGLRTALDSAKAAVASAEQEMTRTEVRATTSGQIAEPLSEIGDNLSPGGICATLIDTNPMLFVGQVPERDITSISVGMNATATLVGGKKVEGKINYLALAADPQTRTFTIEITLPNADQAIRDGLTASAIIQLKPTEAYQVASSWLTLADDGQIGIRAVASDNKVVFHPVTILSQDETSMWVSGLEPNLKVITLGQNYVAAGETVVPLTEEQMKALEKTASQPASETKS